MSAVADLLNLAGKVVDKYAARLHATKERRWEHVLDALDMLKELTAIHLRAINDVVTPVVEQRDLVATCRVYRLLVNADSLPRGYDEARGILEAALKFKQFKGGTAEDNPVKVVLARLSEFQRAAFLLELNSWGISDTLEHAEELWSRLTDGSGVGANGPTRELQRSVSADFAAMVDWVSNAYPKARLSGVPELNTSDDVVDATRTWCKAWQRHVQATLYGERGLNHAIGVLKMAR